MDIKSKEDAERVLEAALRKLAAGVRNKDDDTDILRLWQYLFRFDDFEQVADRITTAAGMDAKLEYVPDGNVYIHIVLHGSPNNFPILVLHLGKY